MQAVLIWDLPLRLFHWLLVLSFALAWGSAGDDRYLNLHLSAGYVLLALLLFRLVWGIYGGHHARFKFLPLKIQLAIDYAKGIARQQTPHYVGHNPLGSWAVLLLLGLLFLLSFSGISVLGGEERQGLLKGWLSPAMGDWFRHVHLLIFQSLQILLSLHIIAVFIESYLQQSNLIKAMLTGYKSLPETSKASRQQPWVAALLLFGSISIALGVYHQPANYEPLPDNQVWRAYCGECHLAYHPSLLPAAAWQAMLAQDDHFEEALDMDEATALEILAFLTENAAETALTEAAWKIKQTTPTPAPLRITKTPHWQEQHQHVAESVWQHPQVISRSNCAACHQDAEQGWFQDSAMRLPSSITNEDS